jgi:hypothetical protein
VRANLDRRPVVAGDDNVVVLVYSNETPVKPSGLRNVMASRPCEPYEVLDINYMEPSGRMRNFGHARTIGHMNCDVKSQYMWRSAAASAAPQRSSDDDDRGQVL